MSAETITVTVGSATVTGSNTHFLTECGAGQYLKYIDGDGGYRALEIKSIESDTSLTLFAAAPAHSDCTAYAFWRCDASLDTWLLPGKNGTGTIAVVNNNKTVNGTNTDFNPEETPGTHIYYFDVDGALHNNTSATVDSDTVLHFSGFPPTDSDGSVPFVYAAPGSAIGDQVTGDNGVIYSVPAFTSMPILWEGPAVSALIANGWSAVLRSTGFQPTPAPSPDPPPATDTLMLSATDDPTPYTVIGQDGLIYDLIPTNDYPIGGYGLVVPRMAVNAAIADGWTIV